MSDKVKQIAGGSLLFHGNCQGEVESITRKIAQQLEELCPYKYDQFLYRIDWRILYGKKFANE